MIRLLLDEALCVDLEQLQDAGVDAVHVRSVGLDAALDRAVLQWAWNERRLLITANVTDPVRFARTAAHRGVVFLEELMFPPVSQMVHLMVAIEVVRAALAEGQLTENRMLRVWDRSMWEWRGGRPHFLDPFDMSSANEPPPTGPRAAEPSATHAIDLVAPTTGRAVSRLLNIESDAHAAPETEALGMPATWSPPRSSSPRK